MKAAAMVQGATRVSRATLTLSSTLSEIERAQQRLLATMADLGHEEGARFAVRAALEEALTNAIEHGSRGERDRTVTVVYEVGETTVVIEVADNGKGFDPVAVPDPTRPENIDIPSGRGLMLMRSFMSDVEITPPGNRIRMVWRAAAK